MTLFEVKALQIAAKFKIQAFVTTTRKSIHVDQCAQIYNLFIPVPITNLTVLWIQVQIYPFVSKRFFFFIKMNGSNVHFLRDRKMASER